jgi:hypothetical protein
VISDQADKAGGSPQEMANSTIEFVKKQHPDTWSDTISEHTNAPYMKDAVEGPLGALGRAAKKAANTIAEAAATRPEEAQGTLSDEGAKAEWARAAKENPVCCVVVLSFSGTNHLFVTGQGEQEQLLKQRNNSRVR